MLFRSAGDVRGELRGQVLERPEADLLVALPDDAEALELRIYSPRWTGDAFTLEQIGRVALR